MLNRIVLISQVILVLDFKKSCIPTILAKKCSKSVFDSKCILSKVKLDTDVLKEILGNSFIKKITKIHQETFIL